MVIIKFEKVIRIAIFAALYSPLLKHLFDNRFFQLFPDVLFFILLLLLALPDNSNSFVKSNRKSMFQRLIYLFIIISVLQIINPNIPSLSIGLEGFRKTSFYLIALLIGTYLKWDGKKIKSLLKFILVVGVPICLYAFKQYYYPSVFDYKIIEMNAASIFSHSIFGNIRATSIFASPFTLGIFANVLLAIALYLFYIEKKIAYLLSAVVVAGAAILSITRVNFVALLFVLFLASGFYFQKGKKLMLFIGVPLLLLSLAIIFFNNPIINPLLQSLSVDRIFEDHRLVSRFSGYEYALFHIKNNIFLGYGMGSAGDTLSQYFQSYRIFVTPHNMFLKVLFETGLIGFIIFVAITMMWLFDNRISAYKAKDQEVKDFNHFGIIIASTLFINGLALGILDAFPANAIIFLLLGLTYRCGDSS
jgi:O-antigen ligase